VPGITRIRGLAWIVAVAATTIAPLTTPLLFGYTLTWRDTARIHAPLREFVATALREFRLPLWNPHESTGVPLFAQMVHGVLHPVSVVAAFALPHAGTDVLIVAYATLASLGAALLARQLGASRAGAATAGFGFGLSGYVLSMSSILHYLAAASTAPWAILALRVTGGRARDIGTAALAIAALHLAGDPQWALVAAVLGIVLAVERRGVRGLGGAAASIILGTALAGIQLVPSWTYLENSARGSMELTGVEREQWALAPWRLLELVVPGFFSGRPGLSLSAPVFIALGRSPVAVDPLGPTYAIPFVPSVYVGIVLLVLAVIGVTRSRASRLLGGVGLVLLWLALGSHLGAEQALHRIPIWGAFRYSEKMVGPFGLCLALLAGLGATHLERNATRSVRTAITAAAIGGCAFAAWFGAGGGEALLRLDTRISPIAQLAHHHLAIGALHAAAGGAALAILLASAAHVPALGRHLSVAAAVLVFLQAAAAAPYALHAGTRDARQSRPLTELVGTADVVRIATPLRGVLLNAHPELDRSDEMLALESRMGVTPYAAATGLDQIDTYTALIPWQRILVDNTLGWDRDPGYWAAMRRYAITHVVLRAPRGPSEAARAEAAVAGGRRLFDVPAWAYSVWEVPHRPWATFVERVVEASTAGQALRVLRAAAQDGGPDAVVEGWSPDGGFPSRLATGRVLRVERGTDTVRIEGEATEHGLLLINDAYWPGWTASLDGRPVPILRADALVRAVPWPAGFRVLEMRYDPPEVQAGIWITTAAAAAIGILVVLDLRRALIRRGPS
jgi:hypothetical protein